MLIADPVIKIENVKLFLTGQWIHCGINLEVQRGEIIAIVGGSGSGKSTLLREILALMTPTSGNIEVFIKNLNKISSTELLKFQCRWGVLFQQSALFTSLNVIENISFLLQEPTKLDKTTIQELASTKVSRIFIINATKWALNF